METVCRTVWRDEARSPQAGVGGRGRTWSSQAWFSPILNPAKRTAEAKDKKSYHDVIFAFKKTQVSVTNSDSNLYVHFLGGKDPVYKPQHYLTLLKIYFLPITLISNSFASRSHPGTFLLSFIKTQAVVLNSGCSVELTRQFYKNASTPTS